MDVMVKIGVVELALAALSGWVIVISRERPEWLVVVGTIVNPLLFLPRSAAR